ncbi:MAG TPA: nucleotidyltransferase family protein [candidate division Zixibacteria bacterium]|nr:nucleotidyltransferase family protein [candidate division Zixibacteria bacterium]
MIAAVILAAGESSRMGSPKALLPVGGERFIDRIVRALAASKAGRIVVVLGHRAEEIRQQIRDLPVTIVINEDYRLGQLSSLQAAVRELQKFPEAAGIDAVLVHLVDHPCLSAALVDRMIDAFYRSGKLIVVPCYRGRRGHPVIFARALFDELLRAPLAVGAKAVVQAHPKETLEIETDEEGVAIDVDTPQEYQELVEKTGCRN